MQNAGLQYGQGVTPVQESPFGALQNNPSTPTSTLRQFRKKDNVDKVPVGGGGHTSAGVDPANSSHVARVAPHNHYPHKPNEYFRYPSIYDDYSSPYKDHTVKYSEIAESVPQSIPHLENLPPTVLAKHKEKDYVEMCNIPQQTHFNKPYPDHQFNSQQGYPPEMALHHQYMHKEPQGPQMHSSYKPESQYIPKDGTFNHQISPFLKYNIPQSRNYGHLDNSALAPFQRMDPHIARSLMSEHAHMRDFSAEYSPMEQSRIYAQKQRYYPTPIPTNASYQPNYAHRNIPAQQYNYPSCNYPRTQVNAPIGRYPINMERSISPRRGFTENLEMGMNFNPVHQKLPSSYANYPAYAQHYQHRRATAASQEYYHHHQQQPPHVRPHPQYIPAHHSQEVGENHVASNNIRQYLENWAEEEPSSGDIQQSQIENPKYIPRINRDEENEVYVINASELPQYLESGVPLVTSENGQYIFKSNVSIDNTTGAIKILEKTNENQSLPMEAQERVVSLHIVENPTKSDCLVNARPTNLTQEPNPATLNSPVQNNLENQTTQQHIIYNNNSNVSVQPYGTTKPNLIQQVPPMSQNYENGQQIRKPVIQSDNTNLPTALSSKTTKINDLIDKTNLKIELLSSFNDVPRNLPNSCINMPSSSTSTTNQNRLNFDESLLLTNSVPSCNSKTTKSDFEVRNDNAEENLVGILSETHEELDKIVEDTLTSSHIDIPTATMENCETKLAERCNDNDSSEETSNVRIPDDLNLDLESKFSTINNNDYQQQIRNNNNNCQDMNDDIIDLSTSRRGSQEETTTTAPSNVSNAHDIDVKQPVKAKDLPVLLEPEDLSKVVEEEKEEEKHDIEEENAQKSPLKHMPLIDDNQENNVSTIRNVEENVNEDSDENNDESSRNEEGREESSTEDSQKCETINEEIDETEIKNDEALEKKLCEIVGEPCEEIPRMEVDADVSAGKNEESSIFSSSDMEDTRDYASEMETTEIAEKKNEERKNDDKEENLEEMQVENIEEHIEQKQETEEDVVMSVTPQQEKKTLEENSEELPQSSEKTEANKENSNEVEHKEDVSTKQEEDSSQQQQPDQISEAQLDLEKIEKNKSDAINDAKQEKKKEGIRKKRIFSVDDIIYRIGPKSVQNRRKSLHSTMEIIATNENIEERPVKLDFSNEKNIKSCEKETIKKDNCENGETFKEEEPNNNEDFNMLDDNEINHSAKHTIQEEDEVITRHKKIKIISNEILEIGKEPNLEVPNEAKSIDRTEDFISAIKKIEENEENVKMKVEEMENEPNKDMEEIRSEVSKICNKIVNDIEKSQLEEKIKDCGKDNDLIENTVELCLQEGNVRKSEEEKGPKIEEENEGRNEKPIQENEESKQCEEISITKIEESSHDLVNSELEVEEMNEVQIEEKIEEMETNECEYTERSTVIRKTTEEISIEETKESEETKEEKNTYSNINSTSFDVNQSSLVESTENLMNDNNIQGKIEETKEEEMKKSNNTFEELELNKKSIALKREEKSFEEKFVEPLFSKKTEEWDKTEDVMVQQETYNKPKDEDSKKNEEIEEFEDKMPVEDVQYRNVLKIEEDNVLLEIGGELVEISVNEVNGRKMITVIPMSNTATVDFNDNYEQEEENSTIFDEMEIMGEETKKMEKEEIPIPTKMMVNTPEDEETNTNTNGAETFQDVISNENEIIIGDESLEEEINLDLQNNEDPPEETPVPLDKPAICTKAAKKLYDDVPSKPHNSLRDFRRIKVPTNNAEMAKPKKEPGKSSKNRSVRFSTRQKKNPEEREESQNALRELIKRRKMRKEKIRLKYSQYAKSQNVEMDEMGMKKEEEKEETSIPKVASHIVKIEKEHQVTKKNVREKMDFKRTIQQDVRVKSKIEESRKQMASVVVMKQKSADFGTEHAHDNGKKEDKLPSTIVVTSSTVSSSLADTSKNFHHAHASTCTEGSRSYDKHMKFSNSSHPRDLSLTKNVNEHYLSRKDHSNLKKKLSIQEYNSRKRKGGVAEAAAIEKNADFIVQNRHHQEEKMAEIGERGSDQQQQHHAKASTIYSDRQFAFLPNNGIRDPRRRAQYLSNAHTMTRTPSEDSNSSQTSSISSSKSQKMNESCPLIPTTMIINNPTLILHDSYGRELENYKHYKTLLLEKSSEGYAPTQQPRPMKIVNRRKTVEVMSSRPKYENQEHVKKKVSFDDNVQINEIHTTQSRIGKIKTDSSSYCCEVSSSSSDVHEESGGYREEKRNESGKSSSLKVREMIENDWESSNSPKEFSSSNENYYDEGNTLDVTSYKSKNGKNLIDLNDYNTSVIDHELRSPYRFSTTPTYEDDEGLKSYKDEVDSKLNSLNIQILPNKHHTKSRMNEDDILMHKFLRKEQLSSEEIKQIRRIIYLKKRIQQLAQQQQNVKTLTTQSESYELKRNIDESLPRNDLKLQFRKIQEADGGGVKGKKKRKRFRNLYSDSPDTSESEMLESAGEFSVYEGENISGVKLIFKRKTDLLQLQPVVKLQRCRHIESMAKKLRIE